MNAAAIKRQSRIRAAFREVANIKKEIDMKLTLHITGVKNLVSSRAGTITAGKAIRGLGVGVLLVAGTGMYLGITAGDKEGNAVSNEGAAVFPVDWEADLEAYRSSLPNYVDEEGNAVSNERTAVFPVDWGADLEAYRSSLPNYVDEEGNAVSIERTVVFPVDWEADLEAYRSSLPNYVDEEGNPASIERTVVFPVDWEADLEAYRSSLPNYVDEEGNPASSDLIRYAFPSDLE